MDHPEFDERMRKVFVEGEHSELLTFLVENLEKICSLSQERPEGPNEEDRAFVKDFQRKVNEKLANLSDEECVDIIKDFIQRVDNSGFLKWMYIYQHIVQALMPMPRGCGGCQGGCGGDCGGCEHKTPGQE